jgi:hypothetical protein
VLVLGSIVAFATWQLTRVQREIHSLGDQKTSLQSDIASLKEQKELVDQQLTAAKGYLKDVPEAQLRQAIDKQFATAPKTAALLPRIYIHIVDPTDSVRAQAIRNALQHAGYLVLGIETVAKAKGLRTSDVRFYHETDRVEAEKIVLVIEKAGERKVNLNYLQQFENSTEARPNHFEVWLAHGAE